MKRALLLTLVLLIALNTGYAQAQESPVVRINDLIEQAWDFDGQIVTIEGEVVGDVMVRGSHGWVNVSDGTNDIGVWAPTDALEPIRYAGRYNHSGDRVRVTGEFRRADPEIGGELDLRAASLVVLGSGTPVEHPVQAGRPLLAVLSIAMAGTLGYVRWRLPRFRNPPS